MAKPMTIHTKKPNRKPISAAAKARMAKKPTLAQIKKVEAIRRKVLF